MYKAAPTTKCPLENKNWHVFPKPYLTIHRSGSGAVVCLFLAARQLLERKRELSAQAKRLLEQVKDLSSTDLYEVYFCATSFFLGNCHKMLSSVFCTPSMPVAVPVRGYVPSWRWIPFRVSACLLFMQQCFSVGNLARRTNNSMKPLSQWDCPPCGFFNKIAVFDNQLQ